MSLLKGIVYASGHIEFMQQENPWVFKAIEGRQSEPPRRIAIDPQLTAIELRITEKIENTEVPWLDRVQMLLDTADKVYLRPGNNVLRFQQAVHDLPRGEKLTTLGDQRVVTAYAEKYWSEIKYFYAKRQDDFRFDLRRMFSHRDDAKKKPSRNIELDTRFVRGEDESISHIVFDATGSNAPGDLIDWRTTVPTGEMGRFTPEDTRVILQIGQVRQPMTFWHHYREEFHNHAYEFEGDRIEAAMKSLEKKHAQLQQQKEQVEDFESEEEKKSEPPAMKSRAQG